MKKLLLLVMALPIVVWAVPKPMESIENYNVLMVHGAYGSDKNYILTIRDSIEDYLTEENPAYAAQLQQLNFAVAQEMSQIDFDNMVFPEANEADHFIGEANLGDYDKDSRITYWLNKNVFEENAANIKHPKDSYIYNWRSFSNPANSSYNNAFELGKRTWNKGNKRYGEGGFGYRRALMEEAQEVKAEYTYFDKSLNKEVSLYGQDALDSVRNHSDLYHQLASRYILIGHSMGGVVSREYVQGDFYNGDVDKVITLDSPHEGTGALNMQVTNEGRNFLLGKEIESLGKAMPIAFAVGLPLISLDSKAGIKAGLISLSLSFALGQATIFGTRAASPEIYYEDDPLVHYVDPYQTGFGTIDSLNKLDYRKKLDSLPMFRILASQNGMTFSDPKHIDYGWLDYMRYLLPDNYTLPIANLVAMLSSSDDDMVNYVNAVTGSIIGIAGIPIQENGSSIVPAASSEGRHVDLFNDSDVDVKRTYFNAAPYASSVNGDWLLGVTIATDAILAIDAVWAKLDPGTAELAKIAVGMAAAGAFAGKITSIMLKGTDDLTESHQIPLYSDNLDTMKVSKNTFSPIGSSAGSSYTPYLMEDFLYEKPFVNLALNDSKTMDSLSKMNEDARESSTLNRSCFYGADADSSTQLCEVGLYGADGKTVDMARERNYSAFKGSPLKFSSSSDWEKFGVKVDRWERVDGLMPDGSENPGGVPIRHVERYNVPAITVDNWIEKYSFVVDDLMPHRLRQIRMNFNFNEEIAWECDIAKPENASDACEVYKRKAGESWPKQPEKHIPHPVKKNGQFDFVPADYGYNNLLAIQKDNQNTVTISTVNKIGLSNTQRFYYLFKATDNVLKSNWPVRDVVLNDIEGFEAFASVTNYQGFKVDSAYDVIYVDGDIGKGTRLRMDGVPHGEQDLSFLSRQFTDSTGGSDSLDEGQYAWQFKAFASDLSGTVDSSQFYNALFSIDRTAPKFSLRTDNGFVNPDSAIFLVRYKWTDTLHGPDIRAMRWTLEGGCTMSAGDSLASDAVCSGTVELPAMHDVAANEFAMPWDSVSRAFTKKHGDGLYRVKAFAVDAA